jgi:hypothetical protein
MITCPLPVTVTTPLLGWTDAKEASEEVKVTGRPAVCQRERAWQGMTGERGGWVGGEEWGMKMQSDEQMT